MENDLINEEDRVTPRPLTHHELWQAWNPLNADEMAVLNEANLKQDSLFTPEAIKDRLEKYGCECLKCARLGGTHTDAIEYRVVRTHYDLECQFLTITARHSMIEKLSIMQHLVKIHFSEHTNAMFEVLWSEQQSDEIMEMSLEDKLVLADERKQDGNANLKLGDWREAMFGYAEGWTKLLPYYDQAFDSKDPRYMAIGKFECTLIANIGALAIIASKDTYLNVNIKNEFLATGLRAIMCAANMHIFTTVGQMIKIYKRSVVLYELLKSSDGPMVAPDDMIMSYKEQADKLQEGNFDLNMVLSCLKEFRNP